MPRWLVLSCLEQSCLMWSSWMRCQQLCRRQDRLRELHEVVPVVGLVLSSHELKKTLTGYHDENANAQAAATILLHFVWGRRGMGSFNVGVGQGGGCRVDGDNIGWLSCGLAVFVHDGIGPHARGRGRLHLALRLIFWFYRVHCRTPVVRACGDAGLGGPVGKPHWHCSRSYRTFAHGSRTGMRLIRPRCQSSD